MTATVKLVDTAGTLRLDMNGHRVHFTREQALELFVAIGAALDDGQGFDEACDCLPRDSLGIESRQSGDHVGLALSLDYGEITGSVNYGKDKAVRAAIAIAALASEIKS